MWSFLIVGINQGDGSVIDTLPRLTNKNGFDTIPLRQQAHRRAGGGAPMRRLTKCDSTAVSQALTREMKDKLIAKMKSGGLSVRQISRLTGEAYYLIQKL